MKHKPETTRAKAKPIPGERIISPLRTLRSLRGLTQSVIAKQVNVDIARISRLENDLLRETPATVKLKKRIADLFSVNIEEIFPPGVDKTE